MADYAIRHYNPPEFGLCGWCRRTTTLVAEVRLRMLESERYPRGILVDCCPSCYKQHEEDFPYIMGTDSPRKP